MKGDIKVIEQLNQALFLELGAVNQYWLHYRLREDWGYTLLAKKEREESSNRGNAPRRQAGGPHHLPRGPSQPADPAPLRIGQNVQEVLEADLAGEYDVRTGLDKGCPVARIRHDAGDYVSMKLFEELLSDEEGQIALPPRDAARPIEAAWHRKDTASSTRPRPTKRNRRDHLFQAAGPRPSGTCFSKPRSLERDGQSPGLAARSRVTISATAGARAILADGA